MDLHIHALCSAEGIFKPVEYDKFGLKFITLGFKILIYIRSEEVRKDMHNATVWSSFRLIHPPVQLSPINGRTL